MPHAKKMLTFFGCKKLFFANFGFLEPFFPFKIPQKHKRRDKHQAQ
jgi:hypothetical protein